MDSILTTGADGIVGSYASFGIALGLSELDVTDFTAVSAACEKYHPTTVIHLAAITDQTVCEKDPERTYMVNAIGACNVARAARACGAQMVYISTNAIFDGHEDKPFKVSDVPSPQNTYGRSKYLGECLVRAAVPNALIVRTSWIFGGGSTKDKKFVGKIMEQFRASASEIKAVSDVTGTPTYGKDLMETVFRWISEKKSGVVHLTNAGSASRYDMALSMREILKSSVKVVPVNSSAFDNSCAHNEALAGEIMRPWQDALREYIETEWKTL